MAHDGRVPSTALSQAEQCEAFIAAELDRHDHFPGAEIVDWLKNQEQSEMPGDFWIDLMQCAEIMAPITGNELEVLRKYADPGSKPVEAAPVALWLRTLLDTVDPYKATFYWGGSASVAVIFSLGTVPRSFSIEERGGPLQFAMRHIDHYLVYCILLATWRNKGSKARVAREYLCTLVRDEIHRVQSRARYDFENAIAVSPDGRDAIHADEVVVFEEDVADGVHARRYAPGVWYSDKLVLTEEFFDSESVHREATCEEFFHDLPSSGRSQAWRLAKYFLEKGRCQREVQTSDDKIIFYTHRSFATCAILPPAIEILT